MNSFKLTTGDKVVCPHCNYRYDDPVEDFVIPKHIGSESSAQEQCEHCDRYFTVTQTGSEAFEVAADAA